MHPQGVLHLSTKATSQVHRTLCVQRTKAIISLFKQLRTNRLSG